MGEIKKQFVCGGASIKASLTICTYIFILQYDVGGRGVIQEIFSSYIINIVSDLPRFLHDFL